MVTSSHTKIHFAYAILAITLFGFITYCFLIIGSRADDTDADVSITNASPEIGTIITTATSGGSDTGGNESTGVTISEAPSTTTIYVHGQATDANGCEQISTANGDWKLKVYRTNASGAGSGATCTTADNNDCYNVTESALTLSNCTGSGDDTVDYEFEVPLTYWVDPTDAGSVYAATTWSSKVTVTDSASSAVASTDVFEVARGLALNAGASLSYGALNLGATSASDVPVTITNSGNGAIDLEASVDGPMTCTAGSIAADKAKYSLTSDTEYASMTAYSTSATGVDVSIAARTDESTASTGTLYNKIQVPSAGVSGTCGNTITYTAVVDE